MSQRESTKNLSARVFRATHSQNKGVPGTQTLHLLDSFLVHPLIHPLDTCQLNAGAMDRGKKLLIGGQVHALCRIFGRHSLATQGADLLDQLSYIALKRRDLVLALEWPA